MRALVTGAGGFLGRYLVEQLRADGIPVRSFSRRVYSDLEALGVEQWQGDIRDARSVAAACRGCEVVYHTAAVAGVWGDWDHYYSTNTLGTQHVIQGCLQAGVGKLVYTSSPSVTFDGSDQRGVDEQSARYAAKWLCHYPHSKALAEQAVLQANGSSHHRGTLWTCALRPHLIWGPRDPHLVPRVIQRAQQGQLRRVGDGTNLVDMVYVENAAMAHRQAAAAMQAGAAVCGRAYFISQGEPVNCWRWIDQLLAIAGLPPVSRSVSLPTAWRIGAVMEWAHRALRRSGEPRMTRFVALQLGRSHYFDISASRRDFGYQPSISIDEGMRRLANEWSNR